jgi:glucans biosynthesis protein
VFIEPIRKPLPMHLSARCGARTKKGNSCPQPATMKGRCRMHGGAKGRGGPRGERNGAYRHGRRTQEAMAERKMLRAWIKAVRGFIEGL